MLNKMLLTLVLLGIPVLVVAGDVAVKSDHPDKYVVQKGDTLWDISGKFLQHPWLWPEVWRANPQIENPHLIYPGDVISLTYQDGQPILTLTRGAQAVSDRTVKLSPTIRVYEKAEAIPTIPIDAIKQFLMRPLVVSAEEMDYWPYVVSSYDEHLIAGTGNRIYVRGLADEDAGAERKRYAVYRKGKPYINPRKDKDAILGYEALYVGDAVIEKAGDPAVAVIAYSSREVLVGDRLAEESETETNTSFMPLPPDVEVSGNIISVIDGVSEIGQYQVVVLDLGTNDGVEVGNVLGIYQSGNVVRDRVASKIKEKEEDEKRLEFEYEDTSVVDRAVSSVANDIRDTKRAFDKTALVAYLGKPGSTPEEVLLPEEYSGVVMIFRIFENVSYGLIMEAVKPIHIYDAVMNL